MHSSINRVHRRTGESGTKLHSYFRVSEIEHKLRAVLQAEGHLPLFMVPSSNDRELLLDIIGLKPVLGEEPPDIRNWADLYRGVAEAVSQRHPLGTRLFRRQIDPPDHHLILRFLISRFERDAELSGLELPPGVRRPGFVPLLGNNVRELMREEISPMQLGRSLGCEACGALCPGKGAPEYVLCRLYHDYVGYLDTHGLADSAQIPALTRPLLQHEAGAAWARMRSFIWIGFLSFTNAQLNLVRAVMDMGASCEFFIPETGLGFFRDAAEQLLRSPVQRAVSGGRYFKIAGADGALQAETLARQLALWPLGEGAFSKQMPFPGFGAIAALVPGGASDTVRNSFSRYRVPFCSRAERSAEATVIGEVVRYIWESGKGGWTTQRTFYLLSNPCLAGDALNRRAVFETMPEGRAAWSQFLTGTPVQGVLERLCVFYDFLCCEKGHTPPELLQALFNLIEEGGFVETLGVLADKTPSLDWAVREVASVQIELERKIRFLEELRPGLGEAGEERFSGSEAVGFLLSWAKEATPSLPPRLLDAVTLYSAPPPVLSRYPVWIMMDVDAAHWPGSPKESPLLGEQGRLRINEMNDADFTPTHVPTLLDERQQKEALFRRLMATGEELVILCRSLLDAQGRPLGDSAFVPVPGKSHWECAGEYRALMDSLIPSGDSPVILGAEVHACDKWTNRHPLPVMGMAASAFRREQKLYLSALDNWIDCPFAYWCRNVLRLEDSFSPDPGYTTMGTLVHLLWERVWMQKRSGAAPLTPLAIQVWEEWMASPPQECRKFVRDSRWRRHLLRLRSQVLRLCSVQEGLEERWVRAGLEREAVTVEYQLPLYTLEGMSFTGRCDRVDTFAGNGEVIVDYKLGKSSNYRHNLQLAAYAEVMREQGASIAGYYYLGLADAGLTGAFTEEVRPVFMEKRESKPVDLETEMNRAREQMAGMAEGVKSGVFPADYTAAGCSRCVYKTLCRRGEYCGEALRGAGADEGETGDA